MITSLQMALGITAFSAASCVLATRVISDDRTQTAFLLATILATLNGVAALVLARTGARTRSTKGFFGAVFGGMVLRMATTLIGFLCAVKLLLLPIAPFALALLFFTGLFTAGEVTLWSRQNFSPRTELS